MIAITMKKQTSKSICIIDIFTNVQEHAHEIANKYIWTHNNILIMYIQFHVQLKNNNLSIFYDRNSNFITLKTKIIIIVSDVWIIYTV